MNLEPLGCGLGLLWYCMLKHSFCHLPGIGPKKEHRLWERGILTWEDFLESGNEPFVAGKVQEQQKRIRDSLQQLGQQNAEYFAALLPKPEMWRLFGAFQGQTAYLDIETTGMGPGLDHITCIGLFDGREVQTFVHGRNLEAFADRILDYKLLVTFNGSCFDLPFIERELQIRLPAAHIDLRFLLKGLGYAGGLKSVEQVFGLDRGLLKNADGYLAVLLWDRYRSTGNERYLETLLAYNAEDVINLEFLMSRAYNLKRSVCPFDSEPCSDALHAFPNPYTAHAEILGQFSFFC